MGQIDNSFDLIEQAWHVDLYARRHRIIFALDVGEYDCALMLCEAALADCEKELSYSASATERARHGENLSALRAFRQHISAAAHAPLAA